MDTIFPDLPNFFWTRLEEYGGLTSLRTIGCVRVQSKYSNLYQSSVSNPRSLTR